MIKHKVLFVCVHNSARSQMAEAFLKQFGDGNFESESAGLEPGTMNFNVIEVMKEKGIDLSNKSTQSVFNLFKQGKRYDAVITVCDGAERCPLFPGKVKRIAWAFPDPSTFTGTKEEQIEQTRIVRDQVESQVKEFAAMAKELNYWI